MDGAPEEVQGGVSRHDSGVHGCDGYVSTACLHDLCEACRLTCKYCDSPCQCTREDCAHSGDGSRPVPWVDQARDIARELLDAFRRDDMSHELAVRIQDDPDLFWLRGEEVPPGVSAGD